MSDPRYHWGQKVIMLRHGSEGGPTKFGAFVSAGVAAYANFDETFIKVFETLKGNFPDMGCNFEAFTRHDMLEVESLGPLTMLEPGMSVDHVERWTIVKQTPPDDQNGCVEWLLRHAARLHS
jgi:hypothetical protein